MDPEPVTMRALIERHDGVLLDAYGVLVDARGALPGARELIAELERLRKPYAIVTNDASRSQATYRARMAGYEIDLPPERFVTSGSLLPGYFTSRGLAGARTCVLGTADSVAYVEQGGGIALPIGPGLEIDALVVCDDDGYPFLAGIEHALSACVRALDGGRAPALVLPNPDLVYPKGGGELGFTAGAIALLIEAALARRFPALGLQFERLGKPEPHLFAHAAGLLGVSPRRLVMIGDQIDTDVAGARAAGVPVALLEGVSRWEHARQHAGSPVPTYLLESIAP
jgi:ribonucleotide monophosphatase NagD (HAD superfamily)|nr:HAD hydrolase-like protein [Kofleriaceae bacterium]